MTTSTLVERRRAHARLALRTIPIALCTCLGLVPVAASASETVAYTYDAKGRLTQVDRCDGTVQAAQCGAAAVKVSSTYAFDSADNRTGLTVTGSAHQQPQGNSPMMLLSVAAVMRPAP